MVQDIEGVDESALAQAYARARGADRMSRYSYFWKDVDLQLKALALVILLRYHAKLMQSPQK